MKIIKSNKGITLIALVVTIIVLLILAGISINMVLGQNGLIGMAQKASNTMANATADETTQMESYTNEVFELTKGYIDNNSNSADLSKLKQYFLRKRYI